MNKYPKMMNLFKLCPNTFERTNVFTCPEFEYLMDCDWEWTEKIDGMNIRVIFDLDGNIDVRGRTDKAILNQDLVDNIKSIFTLEHEVRGVTFYGEGYGAGIQKGGRYSATKSFILFDIHHDIQDYWYDVGSRNETAKLLGIPQVPVVTIGSVWAAYSMVKAGLQSRFGQFYAEGLVGRPIEPLMTRGKRRIIVKIKHRDYYGKELVNGDT